MIHYGGDELFDVYETLNVGVYDQNYDRTKSALTNYYEPKKNKELERFELRKMRQFKEETFDQFATRLREKMENCEFADKDGEIKSHIIQGCPSQKTQNKMFKR